MSAPIYSIGSDTLPGLSKVLEEIGELGEVLGKVLGCGGMEHWTGDLTERIIDECADVIAAIGFYGDKNFTDEQQGRFMDRVDEKTDLFETWHKEQTQDG